MLIGGPLRPGDRRRARLGRDPGDDRDDVPASRAEQAKAIGVYGFVASAGGSIGLLLGGVLTQAISWHWIFIINLPIGIATAFGGRCAWSRTATASASGEGADIPGAALITGSLMIGVYTILGSHRARLGLDPDAGPERRLGRPAGAPSSPARRGSPTR